MSEKLKVLLEKANSKNQKKEDGTVSDLGLAPTGHITNDEDKDEIEND